MSELTLLNLSDRSQAIKASVPPPVLTFDNAEQFVEIFQGIKTASGKTVTYEKALRCSAVLSCVHILTEDIASLPLILKRKTPTGAVDAVEHPAYRLLKVAPNEFQTAFELREHMMLDLLLTGYFYNWQQRNGVGRLTKIVSLPAQAMAFQQQRSDGSLVWTCGAPGFPNQFAHWDLWRGTILNHYIVGGRSLVLLAREAIGLAIAAEEQGARLFSNGIQTNIVFKTDNDLGPDGKAQFRDALNAAYAGSTNSWNTLLLDNGMDVSKIGLTAQESQYMEARHYQLSDIARLFRIPGVMLGLNDKTNTFAAAEQFFQAYGKHTLGPYTGRIEQTGSRDLLLERESDYFLKHDYSQLLKADMKTRYDAYKIAIQGGYMQPQEARAAEDWAEVDGLDFTLVPANFAIVRDGELEAVPTSKGSPADTVEKPVPEPGNPDETDDQPSPNGDEKANKLANRTAASIVRSEVREFARNRSRVSVSKAHAASFAAWHVERVMDLTGASATAAREYSEWRAANVDADEEALRKLVNLCLEAAL